MNDAVLEDHADTAEVCYTPRKRSVVFDTLTGTSIGTGIGVAVLLAASSLYSIATGRKFYESLKKDISNDIPYILLSGGIGSIGGFIKAQTHNSSFEVKYSEHQERIKAIR